MLPDEEWRTVTAWPAYDVSRLGRVRSVPRILGDGRRAGGKLLAQSRDGKGYWRVTLRNGPLRRTVRVHVLVAAAFIGPRPAGMQVLHKDDDHDRNDIGSLRYGTEMQNKAERVRRERKEGRKGKIKGGQVSLVVSPVLTPESRSGVTLAEACKTGVLPIPQATAKTWRRRYGEFPQPVGYDGLTQLFDPADLREFARLRGVTP